MNALLELMQEVLARLTRVETKVAKLMLHQGLDPATGEPTDLISQTRNPNERNI